MATKYYTHFVTARAKAQNAAAAAAASANANANEWSGVVELRHPLEHTGGTKELRALLAQSFDLESEDIIILHWARLH
jgi:ribosomal protein L4